MNVEHGFQERGPSTPAFQTNTIHPTTSPSTTAAYGVLILIAIYYFLQYLEHYHLPLSEILWNSLVYITPFKMISFLDPESTPPEAEDSEFKPVGGFNSQQHAAKSNAMRRVFRLDGTSIMTAVQRTRAISDLGSVFKSKPVTSLPGLGNWDHSCYQNSVIQGLASLECLPGFLREQNVSEEEADKEGATRKALRALTQKLNDETNMGKTFWTPSELKSMSSWQQQDAQEYFSKIMDGLEKDAVKAKATQKATKGLGALSSTEEVVGDGNALIPQTSRMSQLPEELHSLVARNPVEGLLAQRVGCQQCGYVEGLSLVPFNCLTVPLGRRWMYDVRECLDEYTALEPINGVECYKCTLMQAKIQMEDIWRRLLEKNILDGKDDYNAGLAATQDDVRKRLQLVTQALEDEDFSDSTLKKCQIPTKSYISTTKSRQAVIARAPKALVVHINRSIFDETTGEQSKNHARVEFPKRFGLGSWCLGSQEENSEEIVENWNTDPKASMLPEIETSEDPNSGPAYELRAVVTHYGRHENGHYICYRRSPYTVKIEDTAHSKNSEGMGPWWRLSDEEVTPVSEDTVLAQGGVFMLFYERVPFRNQASVPIFENATDASTLEMHPERKAEVAAEETDAIAVKLAPENESSINEPLASEQPSLVPGKIATDTARRVPTPEQDDSVPVPSDPIIETTATRSSPPKALAQNEPLIPSTAANSSTPAGSHPLSTTDRTVSQHPTTEPTSSEPSPEESTTPIAQTISPRTGRGRGNDRMPGKAMEQMAGFVQAN